MTVLEGNIGQNHTNFGVGKYFLEHRKKKIDKLDFIKSKPSALLKKLKKMKRQATDWEKI